ncbi:MAG: TatD family hydrolase [Syntrophobacterales bacterium]|nr:TatD family hydrolase [Syntrophobacterales bacterium]
MNPNSRYPLIDGHAHLNELKDLQRDLKDAKDAGVRAIVGMGMDLESNRGILDIAADNPGFVFPAIGYHPWEIRNPEIETTLAFIEKNIESCVAIGEAGLDYKARVKKALQKEVFQEIIQLSARYRKILILHCRYSHQRVFSMITTGGVKKAVFHWYTGTLDLLEEIIAAGYYVSATPALLYSFPHQQAIKKAPLERVLLETDCPVSYQGRESRPSDVRITLREVARIKGLSLEEVALITTQNAIELYELPDLQLS